MKQKTIGVYKLLITKSDKYTAKQISTKLKISEVMVYHYIKSLKKAGFVAKLKKAQRVKKVVTKITVQDLIAKFAK